MARSPRRVREVPGSNPGRETEKLDLKSNPYVKNLVMSYLGSLKGLVLPPEDLFVVHQTSTFLLNKKRRVLGQISDD